VEHSLARLGFMQSAGAILDGEKPQTSTADEVAKICVRGETDVMAGRLKSYTQSD
jgi:hypothetical protein